MGSVTKSDVCTQLQAPLTSTCDKSSPTLIYRSLNGKQTIRLLKFLPGTIPSCTLISVNLYKAPPYMALSYTWGSRILEDCILVNGYSVAITKNLGDAIRRLHKYITKRRLLLWADSICINQSDLQERNHQVGFMNAIYRCAECVGIWLGESRDESDLAMEKIGKWATELEHLSQDYGDDYELAVTRVLASNKVFYGPIGSTEHRAWQAFSALLQRDWWRRAWIVQEATVLAPSRTFLFCGNYMVDWPSLRAALHIGYNVVHHETQRMSLTFEQSMGMRLDGIRQDREDGAYIRLLGILEHIRAFECQDPRDKVYASLGIAADISELDIVPDYAKSVEAVFTDVVHFVISKPEPHSLDFLGLVIRPFASYLHLDDALPSWIPDLRARCAIFAFEKYLDTDDDNGDRAYNASGNMKGTMRINGRYLHINGFILDTINRVWPPCDMNLAESGVQIEQSWMPNDRERPYPPGGTILDALNHTIVADIGRANIQSNKLERGFAIDWDLVDQDTSKINSTEKKRRSRMLVDLKRTTFGRRLFKTEGGLIGLGAAAADVGDSVCILFGGQVIYILREHGPSNQYEFIGECYVHGMMDGQALDNSTMFRREFIIV